MVEVRRGELETHGSPAILRPVTAEWTAVTPAMRRLEVAAGQDIEEQCRRLGDVPVGSAIVTPAGGLPAELLIHAVVRSASEPVTEASVSHALVNGLRRAEEWAVAGLSLPPMGTGAGNLEPETAAAVMVPILLEWLRTHPYPELVTVVVESEYELDVFERAVRQAEATDSGYAAGLPILEP